MKRFVLVNNEIQENVWWEVLILFYIKSFITTSTYVLRCTATPTNEFEDKLKKKKKKRQIENNHRELRCFNSGDWFRIHYTDMNMSNVDHHCMPCCLVWAPEKFIAWAAVTSNAFMLLYCLLLFSLLSVGKCWTQYLFLNHDQSMLLEFHLYIQRHELLSSSIDQRAIIYVCLWPYGYCPACQTIDE